MSTLGAMTVPPDPMPPITTPAAVAAATGVTVTEGTIAILGDSIRTYCRWHIAPSVTEVLQVRARGGEEYLPLPTLEPTALELLERYAGAGTWHPIAVDAVYQLDQQACGLRPRAGCRWAPGVYRVTLTHGYTPAPAALLSAVAQFGAGAGPSRADVASETLPGHTVSFRQDRSALMRTADRFVSGGQLDAYRLPKLPS